MWLYIRWLMRPTNLVSLSVPRCWGYIHILVYIYSFRIIFGLAPCNNKQRAFIVYFDALSHRKFLSDDNHFLFCIWQEARFRLMCSSLLCTFLYLELQQINLHVKSKKIG